MSSPGSSHITDHTGAKAEVVPEVCAGTSGESEVTDVAKRYPTRKDLENALLESRESEAQLRRIIDTVPTLAWCNLPDGSNEFVNQRWHDYTGLSPQEARGWGWKATIHPEDLDSLMTKLRTLLVSGEPGEIEARLRRHDGEYRWFLFRLEPLRDELGDIVRWYGANEDIHDLRRTKEKLYQAETASRVIFGTIPTMTWGARPDGSLDCANQSLLDYTGCTKEEWQGGGWRNIAHPEDLDRVVKTWMAALATGEPYDCELQMRTAEGSYRWCLSRAAPLRDESGKIVKWYGTNTDIQNLKLAEEKLRADERELRRITDAIPQCIVVLSPEGRMLYANRVTLEYTGLSMEEFRTDDFRARIFHPEDVERLREARQNALSSGVPFQNEQRALGQDGKYRWFLIQYNPLLDEDGNILRWYATGTDINDRVRAEERTRNENLALREQIDRDSMFEDIVGSSEALRKVLRQVAKVAPSDSTVLILGETGTGKELIARAIHKRSNRAERAFFGVNCAAIPASLIASELFGHEKGAFTGATQRRLGRFESANGGTIFLDEVGDLPPEIQIALLRVLQEREIERVGSNKAIHVDVRVLAATHHDLDTLVAEGKFRQDLLYRLSVVPIQMPSLRERADDISLLVDYFVGRFGKKAGKKFRTIEKKTVELFESYQWPGNVRELQNVIERAVILSDGDIFCVDETWLKRQAPQFAAPAVALSSALQRQEKEMIEAALAEARGRVSGPDGAATKLGLPRPTLDAKIKRLGIDKYRFKVRRSS